MKILAFILIFFANTVTAMPLNEINIPAFTVLGNPEQQTYSVSLQILLLMTALTLIPAIVLTMTAFTRVIIVFSILRQAIGMPSTPSNQILIGLAVFLTMYIMSPVVRTINERSITPYMQEQITAQEAIKNAEEPLKAFMFNQIREKDLDMFKDLSSSDDELAMSVIVPAFVTSELKTAFQIGFLLFIPFLIIDLVVASVLMAMGMMMLSPLIISLPFKIMLFVLVDGWNLVIGTLTNSFGG